MIAIVLLSSAISPQQVAANSIAPERFTIMLRGERTFLPYYSSHDLNTPRREIHHVLVMIHGTLRNADVYDRLATRSAEAAEVDAETLIITPQFLMPQDILQDGPEEMLLCWTNNGWKQGDMSLNRDPMPRPGVISSYAALDELLRHVVRTFPRIERITIAGHSAGGQFVNRFAAGTRVHDVLVKHDIDMRYVVSNPSSYLYFCDYRLVPGTKNEFLPASENGQANDCAPYNSYKYGIDRLNIYMRSIGPRQLGQRYAARNVTYLLGEYDNNPEARYLDTGCQAMLQGPHRLARGKAYHEYIIFRFGDEARSRHRMHIVPGVGHSALRVFNSDIGRSVLFESWDD